LLAVFGEVYLSLNLKNALRPIVILIVSVATSFTLRTAPAQAPESRTVVIRNVTVIDGTGSPAKPDMDVVIRGGLIRQIVHRTKVPKDAEVIDGSRKFLIPGLWDMHVHLVYGDESSLSVYVANGVTSVRDMGGSLAIINQWRKEIGDGQLLGPTIQGAAGPVLESATWIKRIETIVWPALLRKGIQPKGWGDISNIPVSSPADAENAVKNVQTAGGDFVKVRTAESLETYLAILASAKKSGLLFASHPPPKGGLLQASRGGANSIEHFMCEDGANDLPETQKLELFVALARNQTWMDPTIVSGLVHSLPDDEVARIISQEAAEGGPRPRLLPEKLAESFRKDYQIRQAFGQSGAKTEERASDARELQCLSGMHRAGVGFLAGTDVGSLLAFPGFSLHEELEDLVKYVGLSPLEAIQAATLNAAKFFSVSDRTGTVEVGKVADLVLLEADPVRDIRNTKTISAVILRGTVVSKSRINEILHSANNP
jgi:imidazolonepropionase-like amidohydrolase